MDIKAIDVKKLREITNAGMMDCKKALLEADGDFENAKVLLREKGQSKADSKSGRTTAQGIALIKVEADNSVILEVNCETDFAAKDNLFHQFVNSIAKLILENNIDNMDQLNQQSVDEFENIDEYRKFIISKLGENITIRRFQRIKIDGQIGSYIHGNKIASLVVINANDAELAKDIAMHIAASKPEYISTSDIPEELVTEETRVLTLQAEEDGKPKEIIEKIVQGKLRKQFDQITLTGQEFVKDPDITINQLLAQKNASVNSFIRYEVGEGIEIEEVNFADEVKAQVNAIK
jgi:elongation factor Ts